MMSDIATDHAHVTSLHDHPNPGGSDGRPHRGGDLPSKPLLDLILLLFISIVFLLVYFYHLFHLEPPAVHLHNAGELGQAQHLALGEVADADLAHEGDHVVLTQGEELDVLDHHHLISVLIEHCILNRTCIEVMVKITD